MVHLSHFSDEAIEAHRGRVSCSVSTASDCQTRIQFQASVAQGKALSDSSSLFPLQDSSTMNTCVGIGDARQMWCIFLKQTKNCKCGQFQGKLLDFVVLRVDDNIQLNLFVKELNGIQHRDAVLSFMRKYYNSWLMVFLREDFTISCPESMCQVQWQTW